MQGYLSSKGYTVSLHRVAEMMREANPDDADRRRVTMGRRRNPIPYTAESFADKYHLDQNEKLVDFGEIFSSVCAKTIGCDITWYQQCFRCYYSYHD